jgi:cysteine desulfuration protein SufE
MWRWSNGEDKMSRATFDDIAADMAFLDDWEDRYRYVIDLGRAMPDLPEELRTDASRVDGCASQVWLVPRSEGDKLDFDGDSDAMIVRGLIAVLRSLYGDKKASEILAIDAQAKFAELGLDQALSSQRSNGLRAMVARLREIAARAEAG